MQFFSGLSPNFPNSEKLNLEGNYNDYFTLYTRKDFEIEALQIFSPDFMARTKDDYREFSIEFTGSQIYIYFSAYIETKSELEKMYSLAEYIITKLEPILQRMKGGMVAMNQQFQ